MLDAVGLWWVLVSVGRCCHLMAAVPGWLSDCKNAGGEKGGKGRAPPKWSLKHATVSRWLLLFPGGSSSPMMGWRCGPGSPLNKDSGVCWSRLGTSGPWQCMPWRLDSSEVLGEGLSPAVLLWWLVTGREAHPKEGPWNTLEWTGCQWSWSLLIINQIVYFSVLYNFSTLTQNYNKA